MKIVFATMLLLLPSVLGAWSYPSRVKVDYIDLPETTLTAGDDLVCEVTGMCYLAPMVELEVEEFDFAEEPLMIVARH